MTMSVGIKELSDLFNSYIKDNDNLLHSLKDTYDKGLKITVYEREQALKYENNLKKWVNIFNELDNCYSIINDDNGRALNKMKEDAQLDSEYIMFYLTLFDDRVNDGNKYLIRFRPGNYGYLNRCRSYELTNYIISSDDKDYQDSYQTRFTKHEIEKAKQATPWLNWDVATYEEVE